MYIFSVSGNPINVKENRAGNEIRNGQFRNKIVSSAKYDVSDQGERHKMTFNEMFPDALESLAEEVEIDITQTSSYHTKSFLKPNEITNPGTANTSIHQKLANKSQVLPDHQSKQALPPKIVINEDSKPILEV